MTYFKSFSYKDYKTYLIQESDTPESVAKKFGIDLYELRSYHNLYCPLEDCIGPNFPTHLKFLILQSEEDKKVKEARRERVRFSTKDFKLPFRPEKLNKRYLAMYTIVNGSETHSIKEELSLNWLSTYKDNYFFIEIDRKSLYVDELEEKSMADEFAERTAKVFYPLQIVVDTNGKCVAVHNFDAIVDRWTNVKKEVLKEFQGEIVEERLEAFENKITNKEIISDAFLNDWFLNAFFGGLNIEYKETGTIEYTIKFPFSQKTGKVKFLVRQKINPTVDQYNLVNITQRGVISDDRSKYDFENDLPYLYTITEEKNTEKLEGTFEAYYFLDPNMNVIESLFLECELKLNIPQKIRIAISNIDEEGKLIHDSGINLYVPIKSKEPTISRELIWLIIALVVSALLFIGILKFIFKKEIL